MGTAFEFYIKRYNNIQRKIYEFCNEVPLKSEEQLEIVHNFSLGTNFVFLESVQDYGENLVLKGYEKVNYRQMNYQKGNVRGCFVENGNYLKEVEVSLPKQLFQVEEEALGSAVYANCVKIFEQTIRANLKYLKNEKQKIETEIEKYNFLLKFV